MKKKIIFQLLTKERQLLTVKEASNFNKGNISLQFCQQNYLFILLRTFIIREGRKCKKE